MFYFFVCCFSGGIADLRGRAEQIVPGEKGYFKLSNVVLQNVPVKYGACYYHACGQRVGTRSRVCLRELDEDGRGIVTPGQGHDADCACGAVRVGRVSYFLLAFTFILNLALGFKDIVFPGGWSLFLGRLVG